jgi:hypothetical protein
MTAPDDITAAVAAERELAAAYADRMSERWTALAEAGGNGTIDAQMARTLRRFMAGFAMDIRAEMHVPVEPAGEVHP